MTTPDEYRQAAAVLDDIPTRDRERNEAISLARDVLLRLAAGELVEREHAIRVAEFCANHARPTPASEPERYPIGWRSAKTLDEIIELREACTLRFPHGPHTYEVPGIDSLDPTMAQAARNFVFWAHRAIPDMIATLKARRSV